MTALPIRSLTKFLRGGRGKSQSEIIKVFLYTLIKTNSVSESGSIHVYNPLTGKLHLFNEGDFLFKQGFLKSGENWQQAFDRWEGIAGIAFVHRQTEFTNDAQADTRFSRDAGDVPIKSIVCVPIIFADNQDPFGVVSFHNESKGKEFDNDTIELIEAYVDTLALALEASQQKLHLERNLKVFIVHGREELSLSKLENLLLKSGLEPVVLKNKPKVGPEILEKLEEEIGNCAAGFVLLTPDDEGQLKAPNEIPRPRARQNVIFESGYLVAQFRNVRRVCFLVKGSLEIPSDLNGMLYEPFDTVEGSEARILAVLEEWELIPARSL